MHEVPAAKDIKVYLVDDDRGMVSSTSQWLSLSGIKIQAFADPTALMKIVKPGHPCVVVSDIRMPGINGMELMKLIIGRDRAIPVILITGHGDIPLAVEAIKAGAFEFMSKPFSPEDLLATVKRAQEHYVQAVEANSSDNAESNQSVEQSGSEFDSQDNQESDLAEMVDQFEKDLICSSLERNKGSVSKTMEELNIPRRTLNAKMQKHGISRAQFRA
ncbi:MAG: response regulator [Rhizobiaceae bacterium]|nr:response regulator [Rhizobiaceae bacterium]